ncbi:MFS transporter [Frankia sp. Cr2]|uniref:MFS transporter n=1 Tax=Frankia sp. Cr2 TaxID=3073932 RepID=UPI002AD1E12E|nr:MFS transporter [Frankia sp. Cr2]
MASRTETTVIYAAGAAQGIVLVTFPAASAIFTDPDRYDLSSTQYGSMFLPQVVTAVTTALLGAHLGRRFGTKRVYLAGLCAGLVSMTLLVLSQLFTSEQSVAYAMLLLATASLGAGFGLTVPALNTFTAAFHPRAVDASILTLNALLGLGTMLAPVFVAVFVGVGLWWGLPLMSAILLAILLVISLPLPLQAQAQAQTRKSGVNTGATGATRAGAGLPARLWVYAAFAVVYGLCETVNGNWAQLDMTGELGASTTVASLALTAFWAAVTGGRVLFAAIQRWFPARWAYHLLPVVLTAAFVIISMLPPNAPALGVVAFGLAGLGCSALLPLTISFGQEELTAIPATVSGTVIACYQLGYGIAAFGVGPLHAHGISLATVFGATAAVAVAMGLLSFLVAGLRPSPAAIHPRPNPAIAARLRYK